MKVGAANLQGNGAALGTSITKLCGGSKTLADGRGDLFGTVKNLQAFTKALSDSDSARAALQRAAGPGGRPTSPPSARISDPRCTTSAIALNQVAGFVNDNAAKLHTDIGGLKTLTDVLVKEQASLNETLAVGRSRWRTSCTPTSRTSARSAPAATSTRSPIRRPCAP